MSCFLQHTKVALWFGWCESEPRRFFRAQPKVAADRVGVYRVDVSSFIVATDSGPAETKDYDAGRCSSSS
jgi:hypothetical protein